MQINATLVKGKARVQFGANKVLLLRISHYLRDTFPVMKLLPVLLVFVISTIIKYVYGLKFIIGLYILVNKKLYVVTCFPKLRSHCNS